MDILILRFDAPLMSFGGVMVDQHGPTDRFPGQSLLAGLCGNALGLTHKDATALEALQQRVEYAARWDVEPVQVLDYHTVELGQDKMSAAGWTTRGKPEHRRGGPAAKFGTHQRYRYYWANGVMTVALTVLGEESPTIQDLAEAFRRPARPLFIGRKTCLPSAPLLIDVVNAPDVLAALEVVPLATRPDRKGEYHRVDACWPMRLGLQGNARVVAVYDRRDWRNQIVAGRRLQAQGYLFLEPSP